MHITIARHYCGSEIATSEKISFSGELASCGMEDAGDNSSLSGNYFKTHCCDDKVSVLAVENNYAPSFFEFKAFSQSVLQVFYIPESYNYQPLFVSNLLNTNVHPPGDYLVSDVNLPDICVFRI
jgi:hypothetical protein